MRNWYRDPCEAQRKRETAIQLAQTIHDVISAAGGGLVLLLLAWILTGARLWW